ncbi:MAG TPA: hypothetical protein VGY53_03825, partial [Isosphaeraceae bacterium]|nr:hypothetical protein [Isosphaeraceae bacterium]
MGNGVGWLSADLSLELGQAALDSLALGAGHDCPGRFEHEPVLSAGLVSAIDWHDRRAGNRGQVCPDGEIVLLAPEQPARPCSPAVPRDVASHVQDEPVSQNFASPQNSLRRGGRHEPALEQQLRLRVRLLITFEALVQETGNVPRALDEKSQRDTSPL